MAPEGWGPQTGSLGSQLAAVDALPHRGWDCGSGQAEPTPRLNLPSAPQDVFCLHTPGGGGYGDPEDPAPLLASLLQPKAFPERGSVYEYRRAQETV